MSNESVSERTGKGKLYMPVPHCSFAESSARDPSQHSCSSNIDRLD